MKGLVIVAALASALPAVSVFAQAPAAPAAGRGQTPAPTTPAPAPARGATPPASPAAQPPAQTLQPSAPFPVGAKFAFVNLQSVAQNTADGKAAAGRVQKRAQDLQAEAAKRAQALQANQQKLQTQAGVMTEAARAQLEKDIATQQRDNDRFEQDAQAEINDLQQQLQNDFQKKLFPILEDLRKEKQLWAIFSLADTGVITWDPGLDLTNDAISRMDGKK